MSGKSEAQSTSCTRSCCDRDASGAERCYWHKVSDGKKPLTDESPDDGILPYDLTGANFDRATLSGVCLRENDFTKASLRSADLINVDIIGVNFIKSSFHNANLNYSKLMRNDFSESDLSRADFSNASLKRSDLTNASLKGATLINTSLEGADLTGADLRDANLTGADLRSIDISSCELSNKTKFGTRLPERFSDLAAHARAYHELRVQVSKKRYNKLARELYILEKKARTREALDDNLIRFIGGLLSGLLTGYGVRPRRVFFSTTFLIALTTLWFSQAGVVYEGWNTTYELLGFQLQTGSLHYSVVTFVTSPPHPPQSTDLLTNLFVTVETYLGTVLTLLLGYTLSNRSRV